VARTLRLVGQAEHGSERISIRNWKTRKVYYFKSQPPPRLKGRKGVLFKIRLGLKEGNILESFSIFGKFRHFLYLGTQ